nr:hypothetical protein [Tanacetum cinerariifolium]
MWKDDIKMDDDQTKNQAKKTQMVWTADLHCQFVDAVKHLGYRRGEQMGPHMLPSVVERQRLILASGDIMLRPPRILVIRFASYGDIQGKLKGIKYCFDGVKTVVDTDRAVFEGVQVRCDRHPTAQKDDLDEIND